MANEKPDLSAFEKAIQRLDEGYQRYQHDTTDTQIRDGLIQRFEFTYELSHKMLKRYLEYASPTPEQFDGMTFQDLIRSGNEQSLLLGEWPDWKRYRDMRGRSSHTYDERVALGVVDGIPEFLEEARFLCDRLREKLA
jgi:nucleotidyltransferase substrate binding protein (TIGR01987 family)